MIDDFLAIERRLIGNSEAMDAVRRLIVRVAPTDSAVLICGESGCGKELVAESLHAGSRRAEGPFVAINCGAIPPTLIEAELFGFEKGSFTGASRMHAGVFERANNGTLLLDEITEMPLEMQARLLRVLETKRVRRVGAETEIPVNVRVLAATNRCPVEAVEAGHLREDIYYRLAVVMIKLPPLRERGEDVAALADYFLAELNQRHGTRKRFSRGDAQPSRKYEWPGNVRQLRNGVERAFVLCDEVLDADADFGSAPARVAMHRATATPRVTTRCRSRCPSARRSTTSSARSSSRHSSISVATSAARRAHSAAASRRSTTSCICTAASLDM